MKFSQLLLPLFCSYLLIMPASCAFLPYSIETIEQQRETGTPLTHSFKQLQIYTEISNEGNLGDTLFTPRKNYFYKFLSDRFGFIEDSHLVSRLFFSHPSIIHFMRQQTSTIPDHLDHKAVLDFFNREHKDIVTSWQKFLETDPETDPINYGTLINKKTAKNIYYHVSFAFIINQLTLAYDFLETEFSLEKLQEPTVVQEKIDNLSKVIKSVESYLNYENGSPLTTQECITLSTFTQLYVNYGKLQAFRWFSEQEDTKNDAFQFNTTGLKMTLNFEFGQEKDQITDLLDTIKRTGTPPRKLKKYPIVINTAKQFLCLEQFLVEGWNESFDEFEWLEDTSAVQDEFKKIARIFQGFKRLAPYFQKKALHQRKVRFIPSLNLEDSLAPFNDLTIINLSA